MKKENSLVAVNMTCGYNQMKEEQKSLGIFECVEIMPMESKLNRKQEEDRKRLVCWDTDK